MRCLPAPNLLHAMELYGANLRLEYNPLTIPDESHRQNTRRRDRVSYSFMRCSCLGRPDLVLW